MGFLRHLLYHVKQKILLIWDGRTIHRSNEVKEFLADEKCGHIHIERLPPYSSDKTVSPYVMDEKDAEIFIGVSQKTFQTWLLRRMASPYICMARKCIRYRRIDLQEFVDSRVVRA